MLATMDGSGDIIHVTESFDIPPGDMRAFDVHFSPAHVTQVGSMDNLFGAVIGVAYLWARLLTLAGNEGTLESEDNLAFIDDQRTYLNAGIEVLEPYAE